jgi:hypothetical protein
LNEARAAFIDGHFVATLLLAMSFIEHALVEELQLLGHTKVSPTFAAALTLAGQHKVFPSDWISRAKILSQRRNPYAHLKDQRHEHGLGRRTRTEHQTPQALVEVDAKDSIDLMYNFYIATLHELPETRKEA